MLVQFVCAFVLSARPKIVSSFLFLLHPVSAYKNECLLTTSTGPTAHPDACHEQRELIEGAVWFMEIRSTQHFGSSHVVAQNNNIIILLFFFPENILAIIVLFI